MMNISSINTIDRNMDQQNRYVKEILDLIDECEGKNLLEDVSETELRQLREHCGDIAMAANTAKKLCKNLKPLAEDEEKKRKEEEEAKKKSEKKSEKKKAAKKDEDNAAESSQEAAPASEKENATKDTQKVEKAVPEPPTAQDEEDDDSFLD